MVEVDKLTLNLGDTSGRDGRQREGIPELEMKAKVEDLGWKKIETRERGEGRATK